jgi:hypothetical protein
MKDLQNLNLSINEKLWLRKLTDLAQVTKTDKNRIIWKLPGLASLRSIPRLAALTLHGQCKRITSLVELELERREADEVNGRGRAKRRSDEDGTELPKSNKPKNVKGA